MLPNSHEYDHSIHCTIFCCTLPSEKPSLFLILDPNIAHVLWRVSNVIDVNGKKEKERTNAIKLDLYYKGCKNVIFNNAQI